MALTDALYSRELDPVEPFHFGSDVADVFDDMAARSIPLYRELQAMAADLCMRFYRPGTAVCDFGCSTGTSIRQIADHASRSGNAVPSFVGIDRSAAMIEKAKEKCAGIDVRWICSDHEPAMFSGTSAVLSLYVLQFINVDKRPGLLKEIHEGLVPGGILLLAEKCRSRDEQVEREITRCYHDFKRRNGYSDLEIQQKDQALKDILVPVTFEENIRLLEESGFRNREVLLKYCNFTVFMAVK